MADGKENLNGEAPHLASYGSTICFPWQQEMTAATNGGYSHPIAPVHPIESPYPPALSFVLRFSSAAFQSQRPSNSSSNTAAGKRREKVELLEAGDEKEKQSNRRSSSSARANLRPPSLQRPAQESKLPSPPPPRLNPALPLADAVSHPFHLHFSFP